MSSKFNRRSIVVGTAGAAAVGLLLLGTGSTGADFTASDTGTVSIDSGNLTIELSDAEDTGTFGLAYPNLAPGDVKVDKFTVKNTGSIPADVSLKLNSLGTNNLAGLTPAQLNMLTASIDSYQTTASVPSLTGNMALGSLNPGQSRTYVVRVGLDQAAGNEWQNRSVNATMAVTLKQ